MRRETSRPATTAASRRWLPAASIPCCRCCKASRPTWSKDIFRCPRSISRILDPREAVTMSGCCSDGGRGARHRQKGYVLVFGALMLFFILVPAAGLAIDVGMMYLVKSVLSAASDGAALAGARALSRGSDDAQQRANAE